MKIVSGGLTSKRDVLVPRSNNSLPTNLCLDRIVSFGAAMPLHHGGQS
jgi:hypothetical protein